MKHRKKMTEVQSQPFTNVFSWNRFVLRPYALRPQPEIKRSLHLLGSWKFRTSWCTPREHTGAYLSTITTTYHTSNDFCHWSGTSVLLTVNNINGTSDPFTTAILPLGPVSCFGLPPDPILVILSVEEGRGCHSLFVVEGESINGKNMKDRTVFIFRWL